MAILTHANALISAESGALCPIVGPSPPAQCDGRDRKWFPVSVVGRGTFCTLGPEICVADQLAACPGPSKLLPFGSKCVQLESDVHGCAPKTSCDDGALTATPGSSSPGMICESGCDIDLSIPRQCDGSSGWTPVSVVRSGTHCVKGPVCSGDAQDLCPEPQRGLPFGSSCVRIPTGVFGCVKNTKCQKACNSTLTNVAQNDSDRCDTTNDGASPNQTQSPTPAVTATLSPVTATLPPPATTTVPLVTATLPPATATSPLVTATLPPPNSTTLTPVTATVPIVSFTPAPTDTPTIPPLVLVSVDLPSDDNATVSPNDDDDADAFLLPLPLRADSFPDENADSTEAPLPTSPESIEIPMLGRPRLR